MLRIIDCLTLDHDLSLVLLAGMICVLGCTVCVVVAARVMASRRSLVWTSLLGLCAGGTAWSTHFVSMLAYRVNVPMTYDLTLTVLSLFVGITMITAGLACASRQFDSRRMRFAGGVVVGLSVAALHYIGMEGLRFPGTILYDPAYVAASLLASIVFGGVAIERLFCNNSHQSSVVACLFLILTIVTLHFLGMSAATIELGPFLNATGVSRSALTGAVTIATVVVLSVGIVAAAFDRRVADQFSRQAERFKMLADGAFEGLIVHQNLIIVDSNIAARKLLGLKDNAIGRSLADWSINNRTDLQIGGDSDVQEIRIVADNGVNFPAEICRRAVMLPTGDPGEVIAIRDLTRRKLNEARIEHLALHDSLTDLPNRRLLNQLVNGAIDRAMRSETAFAILALDLDNFKSVNDMYGHGAGDELIKFVADRIKYLLKDGDVVARLGGDEFIVLSSSNNQPEESIDLAQRIHGELEQGLLVEGTQLMTNASIGVAVFPGDGKTRESLLRNADIAMYESKVAGKATTRFFKPLMNAQLEKRRVLETRLKLALQQQTLTLNYQPLVNSQTGEIACFEALLRWNDEQLGQVSPVDFIPIAEQTGLIVPIGEFVLRQACIDAAAWPAHIRVAVNLSVAQFGSDNIFQVVEEALTTTRLGSERLELEITESLLMENQRSALHTLEKFKGLGIRIAMDDFGTGYSSLSNLQRFNFNKLKIDRSFVSNLENNPQAASIVQAVVSMGKSLQMHVVAEGVETKEQATILSSLACDELQGFLISRPMPVTEIPQFIAAGYRLWDDDETAPRAA